MNSSAKTIRTTPLLAANQLDDRFREPGIFRKGGVDGTDELLVDSLFGTD
jgi:hypothetical protein